MTSPHLAVRLLQRANKIGQHLRDHIALPFNRLVHFSVGAKIADHPCLNDLRVQINIAGCYVKHRVQPFVRFFWIIRPGAVDQRGEQRPDGGDLQPVVLDGAQADLHRSLKRAQASLDIASVVHSNSTPWKTGKNVPAFHRGSAGQKSRVLTSKPHTCRHCGRVLTFGEIAERWCSGCEQGTTPVTGSRRLGQ